MGGGEGCREGYAEEAAFFHHIISFFPQKVFHIGFMSVGFIDNIIGDGLNII